MNGALVFAVPSKGRLMEQTARVPRERRPQAAQGRHERGYRGEIEASPASRSPSCRRPRSSPSSTAAARTSASPARTWCASTSPTPRSASSCLKELGFGRADVVAAVPQCWLDVSDVADLEAAAAAFRRAHGRPLRVATKYINLTRRFFAAKGLTDYRIVESLGATEGTPAAGTADLIVDITTTGATLAANGLKVLDDGVILRSQANLVASKVAKWGPQAEQARDVLSRDASASLRHEPGVLSP